MALRYTYTIFIGSMYWKSFSSEKKAKQELYRLKKDGATRLRLTKERNE